jgi:hypothetical protein
MQQRITWAVFIAAMYLVGIVVLGLLCLVGEANAAPNVCRTNEGGAEMQDSTKSPIRADVMPNGNVIFHFKDDHPQPITINGLEPVPDPTPNIERSLQLYLHKKAKTEYARCMWEEGHRKHYPNGLGYGVKK